MRRGKGAKDRVTILPGSMVDPLRGHHLFPDTVQRPLDP